MKRLATSIAILLVCYVASFAQDIGENVSIFYQDGSLFIGDVEDVDHTTIYLRISTGDIIAVDKKKIKRIKSFKDLILLDKGRYHKTKGMFRNFSFLMGATEEAASVSFDLVIGKRMNPRWNLGAGIGITNNMLDLPGIWIQDLGFFDTFLFSRYFLNNNRWRWYVDGRIGYGWATNSSDWNNYNGGIKIQPGFGVEIANTKSTKWSIGLSQYIQYADGQNNVFDGFNNTVELHYKTWLNRTALTIGLNF